MPADQSWQKICDDYKILDHDFADSPFILSAAQIKTACQDFKRTGEKEVRILCMQDSRRKQPKVFVDNNLFLLPVRNGVYGIIKGEGYVDIPKIDSAPIPYDSKLPFLPDTSQVGSSEMQHLDYAYASSLIRHFMGDDSLILTVRGRKYTPELSFVVGEHKNRVTVKSVQTEVDAGYEGFEQVLLVEAKNVAVDDVVIRQLYYPFRQWGMHTDKKMHSFFFGKQGDNYCFWRFVFDDVEDYNSIRFVDSARYSIANKHG